jgi:hypothetical protein
MKLTPLILAGALALTAGCSSLWPAKKEFFQDKVHAVPEPKAGEKEIQRQAAQLAKEKAAETLQAAVQAEAPPAVTVPAKDTAILTDAVSESLGPPKSPATDEAAKVAQELRTAIAKLNLRLDSFKKENNENIGHKVEGTGLFSVPYFVWLGIVGVLVFGGLILLGVAWTALKAYALTNPPVQLGVGAVQMGAGWLKKAFGEVVAGGEKFKQGLSKVVTDPALQAKITELFNVSHERAQSSDVQAVVKEVTKQ